MPAAHEEELDVVDPTGRRVGRATRAEVHRDGLWHQVFHCLLVRTGEPPRVVLQRRHAAARSFAGKLDLSVTGHLSAGEAPLDGVREVREELGIDVDPARLVALGRRLLADDGGEGRNREIAHVYLLPDDTPLADFRLDPAEVGGLVEIAVEDLLALIADPTRRATCDVVDTAGATTRVEVTRADLVPAVDGAWVVTATMAARYVRGESPLAV